MKTRPIPEREVCLVYTPRNPNLYTLNSTAWLILELCRGQGMKELQDEFHCAIEPLMSREESADLVLACMGDFVRKLIVEVVPSAASRVKGNQINRGLGAP